MPTIIKTTTMTEIIEDAFGEVDVEELLVTSNIPYHVGYRKVTSEPIPRQTPVDPYADLVWLSRFDDEEDSDESKL